MFSLSQGSLSVVEFSIEFRIAAAESGWGEKELKGVFLKSLSDTLKDELASRDKPTYLEELILLAIRIDNRLRERQRERGLQRSFRPRALASSSGQTTPSSSGSPCQTESSQQQSRELD